MNPYCDACNQTVLTKGNNQCVWCDKDLTIAIEQRDKLIDSTTLASIFATNLAQWGV